MIVPFAPTISELQAIPKPYTSRLALAGCVYVLLSTALSLYFLVVVLQPNIANDLWAQTFLADIFHRRLQLATSYSIPLTEVVLEKSYEDGASTFIDMTRSLSRQVLLANISFTSVIRAIRRTSFDRNMRMFAQYCWVDLGRVYELSTTARRQARCHDTMMHNGAVYWEPLLRNSVEQDVLNGSYGNSLEISLFHYIQSSHSGAVWLASLWAMPWQSIPDEVAIWHEHGLTYWQTQLTNYYEQGLQETIQIENALGLHTSVTIHTTSQSYRGLAVWSLSVAYQGLWNDLFTCQANNCSLIRGASNASDEIKLRWEVLAYALQEDAILGPFIDLHVGPMGSMDTVLANKPTALETYYLASIPSVTVDLVPLHWRGANLSYFTGNPMCNTNRPQPFVQDQLSFYDACSMQLPSFTTLSRQALVFAWTTLRYADPSLANANTAQLCAAVLTPTNYEACQSTLETVRRLVEAFEMPWPTPSNDLAVAMAQLNVTLVQFALNDSVPVFLTQAAIAPSDAFSIFGWAMVYDWLDGTRDVTTLDTDTGLFNLMSPYIAPTPLPANPLELPKQATAYISIIIVYSAMVMTIAASLVLLSAFLFKLRIHGVDLWAFHWVASPMWVGRPILLCRGAAALVVLSTAPVSFVSTNGISRFVSTPRSVLDVMVLAGEVNWITYVLVDFLLPILGSRARWYALFGAAMTWVILVGTELSAPFEAKMTLQQSCNVGSFLRFCLSAGLPLMSLCLASMVLHLCRCEVLKHRATRSNDLLPASAQVFLSASQSPTWFRDPTTALMAGILPFGRRYFHVNLWQLVRLGTTLDFSRNPLSSSTKRSTKRRYVTLLTILGILYVLLSVTGSFLYIYVSTDAMTNDFWWASFNTSGHGTFLATLFTQQLQTTGSMPHLDLTKRDWSDNSNRYNMSATSFSVPMLYASMVQNEVNTLEVVIDGLRRMNGCLLPWIATAYCFVDLNRTWELAVSAYRQSVCEKANGAVYLEPILRNGNPVDLETCWGESLASSVFDYLDTTQSGQLWRQSLRAPRLSIADEAAYWRQHGLRFYETQWQNFKSLGVIETYSVANALGFAYPLTIKSSNGSLHTTQQTSFKMQWPLASLLWAISANSSGLSGSSLVRQSPRFAFANQTIASILARNGSLSVPLDISFGIVERTLGPFGTIGMRRVAFPPVLVQWSRFLTARFSADMVHASAEAIAAYEAFPGDVTLPVWPTAWAYETFVGGDIMCPTQSMLTSMCILYSMQGACSVNMQDVVSIDLSTSSLALLATETCLVLLGAAMAFLDTRYTLHDRIEIANASTAIATYFATELPLVLLQFLQQPNETTMLLAQSLLLDPNDVGFHVFGYLYLLEWLHGVREVVTFNGVHGDITALSGRNAVHKGPINPLEVPVNVAYYARCVLLYVSGVLFIVSATASGYIAVSRGHIEGRNMLALNRVTGLVWIGRPLIFLRGITAICLLSTAKLDLAQANGFFYIVAIPQSWFSTIMAAGETTWLVFILNDTFSVWTQQYTPLYAAPSSVLVWAASAIWSLVSPVKHSARLQRSCAVPIVDMQLVCDSGVVRIGDPTRMSGLLVLPLIVVAATYLLQRVRYHGREESGLRSHLLYVTAFHHFAQDGWVLDGVYCVDRASAAINGVLTLRLPRTRKTVLLDIKTWRLFHVNAAPGIDDAPHLRHAIPLR
ncbi:hypothetical protein SPRG_20849 [Saprolegnia parasitica CBS 223.65]|uniref:Uncharacterized protein n=1 Tax=Saprolegnia parasitica (strain CBS 223.65) TaxID=695850 RepID=A0A067C2L3_SAPPC|nr:hypothetical protein SPRG_20849 [Saprolegnia parasitica CBS 223.65]KDO25024.1 hypothetical protein SPRG_20849 [Saprolegnia parasitica CBS 223.65]|eukprot:XP_012204325.1 hypothetical protein SPRG_20849 [Saprolegnia parasitica CBS 223.65]